ncbi:MAG: hypothetical protein WDZ31_00895 [Phycisphaeraceae bacterium]
MAKRLLLIVIATAAALGLFVVTLLVGPADEGDPAQRGPRREGPVEVVPEFDPDRITSGQLANPELVQEVRQGVYRYPGDDRTTLLFYERFTPGPHGVLEVEQPIAQVYFSPERVLEIRADACTFVAPDNQPRGGDFRGNVVVTLFETVDGSPVAFDNPDHVQLRTHLDDVSFDLDLGQLESDGPVDMTGREVTFRGRGLSLIYNELRRRIERLEIAEGELLRFAPQRQPATADAAEDPPGPVSSVTRSEDANDTSDVDANADAHPADTDEADAPPFYRARFERAVEVDAEGGTVQIAADVLDAVFTLRSSDWNASANRPAPGPGPTQAATASAAEGVADITPGPDIDPTDVDAAAAPPTAEAVEHELAVGEVDEDRAVTIRWQGPMVLEPEPRPDAALAGPDDVLLRLVGQPARLETAEGEQLAAREIEYLTRTGHIRATGTEQAPLHLRTADVGELQAIALEIDQVAGTGRVEGPGWLASAAVEHGDEADEPDALRVAWRDRLDLRFHRHAAGDDAADRLAGLEAAQFHGQVHVDHADFQLDAGQLALHMTAPDGDAGRQNIRTIEATDTTRLTTTALPQGRAASVARADAEVDPNADAPHATLESGSLTVAFDVDAQGDARARQVIAHDAVTVNHPDWRLAAGRVEAELADDEIDEAIIDVGSARGNLRRLTAERDVEFIRHEDSTEGAGHRMVVDIPADQLELFSDPEVEDVPARVIRPDATLAGPHLILRQLDRSVQVQGPGWLDVNLDPDDPTARLMVNWQQSMHYADDAGAAHVVGDVNARSETATNRTRLTSQDLRFELADADEIDEAMIDDRPDDLDAALGRREVRFATARDDALFTAETLDPDTGDRLSRLRLEGPLISFDGSAEQVQVIGPGRMLIEDHRPQTPTPEQTPASEEQRDEDRDDDASPPDTPDTPLAFSGRGATLFLWQRQLTLDAAANDVLFEQGVQMIHRPTGEQDVLQLDANRLLADMAETGGLANWTAGDAPDPDLRLIRADGTVRILHAGRTIETDHLQYTADDQIVRLWAEPGREVHVTRRDQPTGFSAESFWWDLARDRFEARRPGPGIVPLPGE